MTSWVTVQPARIRALVEPSWNPIQAAVALAAHHEQEALVSLSKWLTDLFKVRLLIDGRDVVRETFGIPIVAVGLQSPGLTPENLTVIIGGLRSLISVFEGELQAKEAVSHAN